MLVADRARDYSRTVMLAAAAADPDRLVDAFTPLEARARQDALNDGQDAARLQVRRSLDARYTGQSHELNIPHQSGDGPAEINAAFHAAHAARYGYHRPEAAVEIVTLRLSAVVPSDFPALPRRAYAGPDPAAALVGRKPVWFNGGFVTTDLYERDRLGAGNAFAGPAVVYQYDTTTLVPPGWAARVDGRGNLILETPDR